MFRYAVPLLVATGCATTFDSVPRPAYGELEARPSGAPEADYDVRALTTVDGEVMGADRVPVGDKLAGTVRLALRTDSKSPVTVLLAPGWYMERRGLRVSPAERVEITGSRVLRGGEPVIMASEIRSGGQVLKLRDETGRPLWTR